MATKDPVQNLTKLNGKNFTMWKFGVTFLLESQDLIEFVDGTAVEPNKQTHLDEWKKWKKASSKAAVILLTSIEQELHANLINCDVPQVMWEKIKSLYGDVSEDAKQNAWQQFYEFKIKDGEKLATQIELFESLCKKLENAGEKLTEASVMSKLLSSLPSCFSTFSMAWECTPKNERKKENLIARILREEKRLIQTEESVSQVALQVKAVKLSESGGGKTKKNKIDSLKKRTKCNYCKEKGHWARECKKRLEDEKQNKRKDQRNTESDAGPSTYICDVTSFYTGTLETDNNVWIADSGASMHMTSHREYFSEFKPETVQFVKIADNKLLAATGIGKINIQVELSGKLYDRQLSDVLYVPDLKRNLFSVGALSNKMFSFHCYGQYCEVRDSNGTLSAIGSRLGNLFCMNFKVKMPVCNIAQDISLKLWHERLGHINIQTIKNTEKSAAVEGLQTAKLNSDFVCETCILAKQNCRPHVARKLQKSFKPGEKIHSDVCGPTDVKSPNGTRYFLLFKDECSEFRTIYFLKEKTDVFTKFQEFEALVYRQTGNKIKVLRSDNGTEYLSNRFQNFLKEKGIIHEKSSPYIHQQNGCAEREIRTLVNSARSMLIARNVPNYLWPEAVKTASYVLNRTLSKQNDNSTAYEKWFNRKPEVKHLRVFGSAAYLHVPKEKQSSKFNARSIKLLFVGYEGESRNYRLYDKITKRIHVSSDVTFIENSSAADEGGEPESRNILELVFEDLNESDSEIETEQVNADINNKVQPELHEEHAEQEERRNEELPVLRDRGTLRKPAYLESYALLTETVPLTYEEAMSSPEAENWKTAMNEEMSALQENETWSLIKLPENKRPIGCKWVYTLKTDIEGRIQKYKARLVAKGFTQREGVDFFETFAPVVRYESIRLLLALAARDDLEIANFDVKTAFLNGDLQEELYMHQPPGYEVECNESVVCKLHRSLYGLKQSPRCWNMKFVNFLRKFNFAPTESDSCVFVSKLNQDFVFLALYVDDGLLLSKSQHEIEKVLSYLKQFFQITVEPATQFVGLEIQRNRATREIKISQKAYAKRVIKRFFFGRV